MENQQPEFNLTMTEKRHPVIVKREKRGDKSKKRGKSPEYLLANHLFSVMDVNQSTILCPKDLGYEKLNPASLITYIHRLCKDEARDEPRRFKYITLNPDELFDDEKKYEFFRVK